MTGETISDREVAAMRELKLEFPDITALEVKMKIGPSCTWSCPAIHRIIYNQTHYDQTYSPKPPDMLLHVSKPKMKNIPDWVRRPPIREIEPDHLASIDCPFTCPTCGSAYPMNRDTPFQTMAEALKCCKRGAG